MSKKVLFIVGSLRQGSFNHQLASQAENILAGKAEVSYLDFKDVPFFNQDIESPTPAAVAKAREEILAADAIWLFSPTYNWAIPGTSPDEVFKHYRSLLPFIRMKVVEPFTGVAVNPEAWGTGQLTVSEEKQAELAAQAEALLAAID